MTGPEEPNYNLVAIMLPAAEPWVEVCSDLRVVSGPLMTIMVIVHGATARYYAGEEAQSQMGSTYAPDLNSTAQLQENMCCWIHCKVISRLLRGSVIQHSGSGRRSHWTPSVSSSGATPYVTSTLSCWDQIYTDLIYYLFVYMMYITLFIYHIQALRSHHAFKANADPIL